jgi:hypothetical protein
MISKIDLLQYISNRTIKVGMDLVLGDHNRNQRRGTIVDIGKDCIKLKFYTSTSTKTMTIEAVAKQFIRQLLPLCDANDAKIDDNVIHENKYLKSKKAVQGYYRERPWIKNPWFAC